MSFLTPGKLNVQGSGQFVIQLLRDCRKIVVEIVEFARSLFLDFGPRELKDQNPKAKLSKLYNLNYNLSTIFK